MFEVAQDVNVWCTLLFRMQTILEQLTKKVDSLDAQLQSLKTRDSMSTTSDTVGCQSGNGRVRSEEESNKKYLQSLDVQKVSCMY